MLASPKYTIYIPSKGRWESRLTCKALDEMCVPYKVVVEPSELDNYTAVINKDKILVLPHDDMKLIGSRCWIMEYSIKNGDARHWQVDDNINSFWYWNKNRKLRVKTGATFRACEDFTDRYTNIAYSGMEYFMFRKQKYLDNPFHLNTRIYSCTLVNNSIPYRWRSVYNDDTDVSLMALKAGWCTVLFQAFLAEKSVTMTVKGGNTEQLYILDNEKDGRLEMAKALQRLHPDVAKVTRKWGRWQHQVDYRPFKYNKLIKKDGLEIQEGVNNYGMKLVKRDSLPGAGSQAD